MAEIRLRPHHLLCVQFFEGNGYDDEFNLNMASVVERMDKDDSSIIAISLGVDDICRSCPENVGNLCKFEESVRTKDESVLRFLGISRNIRITPKDLKVLFRQKICEVTNIQQICGECSWSPICNRHLRQ